MVLRIVDAFRMIELVYHDDPGRPRRRHRDLSYYIYTTGFLNQDLGYAAAQAVVMIIVVTCLPDIRAHGLEYREAT